MKVKLRFIPLNQVSKDTVTARGIKNVLDLTLNTNKLWKTVMDHILGKWNGIEELSDRLELFLEGSFPLKSELSSLYKDSSIPVESVLCSNASFQSLKSSSCIKSAKADEVPIIPIYYSIKEKKIAMNVLMSPCKHKDTPAGYSLADESWLHAFDMFNDSKGGRQQQSSPERPQDVKSNNSSSSGCLDNPNDNDMVPQTSTDSLFGQFAADGHSLMGHSLMGGGLAVNNVTSSSQRANTESNSSAQQRTSPRIFDAVKNVLAQPHAKAPSILESDILSRQQPSETPAITINSSEKASSTAATDNVNEEATAGGKRSNTTEVQENENETEKPKQSKRVRFSAEVSSPKKQPKQSIQAIRTISQGQSIPSISVPSTQVHPETFKALFSRVGRRNPTWKRIRPTYIGPIIR